MLRILDYIYKERSAANISLRAFLKEHRYPKSVLTYLQYEEERTFINDVPAKLNTLLCDGDRIRVLIEDREPEGSDKVVPTRLPLDIIYEDEDLLVVNKPAHMPIHSSIAHYTDTLANAVAWYLGRGQEQPPVFRCMNRLDRDTTGVTIISKNRLSAGILGLDIAARKVHREYLAIVEGVTEETGTIDAPIGRVEASVILRQVDEAEGESAVTHYERLRVFEKAGKTWSLLKVWLESGRTHQIRVHMKHIGHPIPGDFLYNPDNSVIERQALHSHSMEFVHPITGEKMKFTAPLPEDMKKILSDDLQD